MIPLTNRPILYLVTLLASVLQQTQSFPQNDKTPSFSNTELSNTTHQNTTNLSNETSVVSKCDRNKTINFIETELASINRTADTVYALVQPFSYTSWYYVNYQNKTVGLAALDEGNKIEQKCQPLINTIDNLLEFINKLNWTGQYCQTEKNTSKLEYVIHIKNDFAIFTHIVHIFQHLFDLTERYSEIHELKNRTTDIINDCYPCNSLSDLKNVLEHKMVSKNVTESFLKELQHLLHVMEETNLKSIYSTNFTNDLLNFGTWKNFSLNETREIIDVQERITRAKIQISMGISQSVIFVIGFVENVLLLLIFIRYKKMRTAPNLMLMNLAFVDCLNLLVNIPVFFAYYVSHKWELDESACFAFRFFHHMCISVSVYSVVVISMQRYLGITKLPKQRTSVCQISKVKYFCTIVTPWLIGSLIASPHIIYAGIYDDDCYAASVKMHKFYPKFITVIDIFAVCVIPLTAIAVLSLLSIKKINQSIKDMPGEKTGNKSTVHSRILSSRVLASLTIVFALSYIPYYLFLLIQAWVEIQLNETACYLIFFITYSLIFGNACFNPIALCISSQTFKCYFKSYFTFKKENTLQKRAYVGQSIGLSNFTKSSPSSARNSRVGVA